MESTIPLNTDINANSFPENLVTTGSVVSIEVAPPDAIGASLPKYLTMSGANSNVATSLVIFEINAITPNFSPAYSEINTLERL